MGFITLIRKIRGCEGQKLAIYFVAIVLVVQPSRRDYSRAKDGPSYNCTVGRLLSTRLVVLIYSSSTVIHSYKKPKWLSIVLHDDVFGIYNRQFGYHRAKIKVTKNWFRIENRVSLLQRLEKW